MLDDSVYLYQISDKNGRLSFAKVINYWQTSPDFRQFYNRLLAESPFDAYFWEHPPLSKGLLNQDYEFVLVNSPALAHVKASTKPFSAFFDTHKMVVDFPNLRGDAHLLVPCPIQEAQFPHLAAFCRTATIAHTHQYWQALGHLLATQVTDEKRWLSTSGLGVYWVHIRWDKRPKYYTFRKYRS
ncbi:MAG: DUF6940 family protein [Lewinella sp.]|uniref:DUF6940 family protein n=1 Tax=Lewinella sp. TaxID=2004506 RepID=UPI003D6B808E